ncbi:MAG TPA: FtsQ-type POTRA domain-containing protein [Gemmatimonadales bacterium]|nr:FtsQ-type POTRA domain-containing protein [Gemmatimonadales bacterium]
MAPSRLSKPGYRILGGIALVVGLWFGLPRLLTGMSFFRVTRVEVRGLRNARADEVVKALPVPAGMSIFDDLAPIEQAADSLPGFERVSVGRKLPGTLVVTLREAEPVALVMRRGKLALVSEAGAVLPFDPTVGAPDLPVIREPDSLVAGLLARVRDADPTFFSSVTTGWRAGDDVMLEVDGQRYLFRPDAPAEVIRAVTVVAQDLAKNRNKRRWAELDARFAGQIVVRWGTA